jgi:hypothetical protein
MKGIFLAIVIFAATIVLLVVGAESPIPTAVHYAGGKNHITAPTTPEAAVTDLAAQIKLRNWDAAYNSLANNAKFTQSSFVHDLLGHYLSLRTYATLSSFDVRPLHQSADEAEMSLNLNWSSVVGPFQDQRDLHLVKEGNRWQVDWPLVKAPKVPPQVIPVDYLRWDVIYPGAGDGWGAQGVAGPHVRIVDMHPVNRADGVVVLGELLNDDVVPAWVSVRASLVGKNGAVIASEGSFDMISHTLLPKQVTPFLIQFHNVDISQISSIRMEPTAVLVSASADPVIEVQDQKFAAAPNPSLSGDISNQSGQIVNFAHVLTTFYDKNGQLVWVAGQYVSRALLPQTPVKFRIPVPEDLAGQINSQRTVVSTYSPGRTL